MSEAWEDWFEKDERLLWQGAPAPGQWHWIRNITLTVAGAPFAIAGFYVSGMGLGQVLTMTGIGSLLIALFLTAFGVPFIAVGLLLVFGTWLHDYLTPTHTRYALTERAGYIATRFWKRNMDMIPISGDTEIEFREGSKGTSSVYFAFDSFPDSDGDVQNTKRGFEGIRDGHKVYKLIRAIKAGEEVEPI